LTVKKVFDDMFSRFDRIPRCVTDRQTIRTDGHLATASSALCITSRGKKLSQYAYKLQHSQTQHC